MYHIISDVAFGYKIEIEVAFVYRIESEVAFVFHITIRLLLGIILTVSFVGCHIDNQVVLCII